MAAIMTDPAARAKHHRAIPERQEESNMPDTHNDQVVGQFTQQAAGYAKLTSAASPDRSAALRASTGATGQDEVLDICCGTGAMALDIATHVARVTGIDLTPAMLEQARAVQTARGIANIDWLVGDSRALPFDDASFSLILCGAAFHHLEEPKAVFAEMARVCRPGGRIVVRDVTPDPAKVAEYDRIETLRDPSHTHALTPDELRNLGEGQPVAPPTVTAHVSSFPFAPILAASHPELCTREHVAALLRADAEGGMDRLGFAARLEEDALIVSYPMSTAVWMRR
jgi:ubiquinone/menaquinone biosynthesis C-methylase UbiE